MKLEECLKKIQPLDERAGRICEKRWDSIAKPLKSLGKLESSLIQIAGIQGTERIQLGKKALVIMCADNGVVAEGVTQTGQEVTAIVAENFLDVKSCAAIMCKDTGTDIFPIDIGMAVDTPRVEKRKIAYGTKNMAVKPAMTREEAVRAIEVGIGLACELKEKGYHMIATGEMGIGNTTTSSAVASVLMEKPVEEVTGKGAGLTTEGLERKIQVIKNAVKKHQPNRNDPVDVLAKVGGFDLAGLAGIYLGGAACRMPVVIDGFISGVAALLAVKLCPQAGDYIIASHVSKEPAGAMVLEAIGKAPSLMCDMCLGEGTGAVAFFPLLDMSLHIYEKMSTFSQIEIEDYVPLE
ncbi:MAG: nicotinate-nucleotide--dimethylbenzimidazole phosphoribosyltransferase [Lachnospiraceae bacterium]|nr:nicotinate-nucleotide--dimethylbenzimidazole phosphoribosyltransferase [Lachnospiraceae bacterium]